MFDKTQTNEIEKIAHTVALKLFKSMMSDVDERSEKATSNYLRFNLSYEIGDVIKDVIPQLVTSEVEKNLRQQGIIPRCKDKSVVDSIDEFIKNSIDEETGEDAILGEPVDKVYNEYQGFVVSILNMKSIPTKKLFTMELKRQGGYKAKVTTRNGKSVRVYTR